MQIIALCQEKKEKKKKTFGNDPEQNAGTIQASNLEHHTFLKAPRRDNPGQNAETINASNPEHLLVFKALRGSDQEQNVGIIHTSNPEHLPVFKSPCGDNLEQNAGYYPFIQSGTPPQAGGDTHTNIHIYRHLDSATDLPTKRFCCHKFSSNWMH